MNLHSCSISYFSALICQHLCKHSQKMCNLCPWKTFGVIINGDFACRMTQQNATRWEQYHPRPHCSLDMTFGHVFLYASHHFYFINTIASFSENGIWTNGILDVAIITWTSTHNISMKMWIPDPNVNSRPKLILNNSVMTSMNTHWKQYHHIVESWPFYIKWWNGIYHIE